MNLIGKLYTNTLSGAINDGVLGKDSSKPINICNENSLAVQTLMSKTTLAILSLVRAHVKEGKPLKEIRITGANQAQFLAAAKIIDLTIPVKEQLNSTFQIRYKALKKSDSVSGSPYFNTIINAFSMPPADQQDPLLLNELDNTHPSFKDMDSQKLANYRLILNGFAQKVVPLHPEFLEVVKKVAGIFADNIEKLQMMSPPKVIHYCGPTGAGKSTVMKKDFPDMDLDTSIASTDNLRNVLSKELNKDFSNSQLFFMGVSMRREIEAAIKEKYATPSLIQEGWLATETDINSLFTNSLPVELHDFDGDLRLTSLRTILRACSPDGRPTMPWNDMAQGFQKNRQCRSSIFKSLQEKDSYQLQYTFNNTSINTFTLKEAQNFFQNQNMESINQEIESVAKSLITRDDADKFGEALLEFEGMTIAEAFDRASKKLINGHVIDRVEIIINDKVDSLVKALPKEGILRKGERGSYILELPKDSLKDLKDLYDYVAKEYGEDLKEGSAPDVGFHISVIRVNAGDRKVEEHELEEMLGKTISFEPHFLGSVEPSENSEWEKIWLVSVHSKELEKIRTDLGMSPKISRNNIKQEFHISIANKPKIKTNLT